MQPKLKRKINSMPKILSLQLSSITHIQNSAKQRESFIYDRSGQTGSIQGSSLQVLEARQRSEEVSVPAACVQLPAPTVNRIMTQSHSHNLSKIHSSHF